MTVRESTGVSAIVLGVGFVVFGCQPPAPSSTRPDSRAAQTPIVDSQQAETSSAVIPPGPACPSGVVAIGVGTGNDSTVLASDSVACAAQSPYDPATCYSAHPVDYPSGNFALSTDHTVRGADYDCDHMGSAVNLPTYPAGGRIDTLLSRMPRVDRIMHAKLGLIQSAPERPVLSPVAALDDGKLRCDFPLERTGLYVRYSDDCGVTWPISEIWDPNAATSVGKVRAIKGGNYKIIGQAPGDNGSGLDRPELYVDPFQSRAYLTVRATGAVNHASLLFRYEDGRWDTDEPVEIGREWSPLVMTSTPDGRLFLFQCFGEQPTLYWSDDFGHSFQPGFRSMSAGGSHRARRVIAEMA